ncbi:MAG: hypothetical protein ACRYF9_24565 [Janthinobacterium lividum]
MRWKDLLIWTPSALFLAWWRVSLWVHDRLGCLGGKSISSACMWNGTDIQGWIGAGMFFGMVFFIVSTPITAIIQLEIWMRRLEKKLASRVART